MVQVSGLREEVERIRTVCEAIIPNVQLDQICVSASPVESGQSLSRNRLVRELEDHLGTFAEPRPEAPVFTSDLGVTLRVTNFNRRVFRPAVAAAVSVLRRRCEFTICATPRPPR